MPALNWLNSWVKLNTKHGMHPGSPGKGFSVDKHKNSTSTASTAQGSEDSPTVSRRPSNKKIRNRGLQRTFSASDLIREAATGSGPLNKKDSTELSSTDRRVRRLAKVSHRREERDAETLSTAKSSIATCLNDSSHHNQFLDEIMYLHDLEVNDTQTHNFTHHVADSTPSTNHSPLKRPIGIEPEPSIETLKSGLAGLLPHPFFANQQVCQQCTSLRTQLEALHEDLEYLRTLALQRETLEDTAESIRRRQSCAQLQSMPSLASMQLSELTTRQRKQVEQLLKERSRWQQDMQFKLSKFANLCKDLNDESALQKSEANKLKEELKIVKEERDSMAEELLHLRAQEFVYKKQTRELELMKERLALYESQSLAELSQAVHARDKTVSELTHKLERVLAELELCRAHCGKRRVIFPDPRRL